MSPKLLSPKKGKGKRAPRLNPNGGGREKIDFFIVAGVAPGRGKKKGRGPVRQSLGLRVSNSGGKKGGERKKKAGLVELATTRQREKKKKRRKKRVYFCAPRWSCKKREKEIKEGRFLLPPFESGKRGRKLLHPLILCTLKRRREGATLNI